MKITYRNLITGLLSGIFVSLIFGQILRLQINQISAIYVHDVLIVCFSLVWLTYLFHTKQRPFLPRSLRFLFLFTIWLVCTQVFSLYVNRFSIPGGLYLIRWTSFVCFLASLTDLVCKKVIQIDLLKWLHRSIVIAAVIGIFQYIFVSDTRFLHTFGWDDHLYRLIGLYFDPGFTGLILSIGFILALYNKHISSQVILFVSILLTYSRASILTLAVILVVYGLQSKLFLRMLSWLVMLVVLIFMLPSTLGEGVKLNRTQSVVARINSNITAMDLYDQSPIWGIGFNNYRSFFVQSSDSLPNHSGSPDNSFVFVLVTSGIIGLLLFLLFLGEVSVYAWFRSPILFTSIVAISSHSFFNNTWFYPFAIICVWIVFASSLRRGQLNH